MHRERGITLRHSRVGAHDGDNGPRISIGPYDYRRRCRLLARHIECFPNGDAAAVPDRNRAVSRNFDDMCRSRGRAHKSREPRAHHYLVSQADDKCTAPHSRATVVTYHARGPLSDLAQHDSSRDPLDRLTMPKDGGR